MATLPGVQPTANINNLLLTPQSVTQNTGTTDSKPNISGLPYQYSYSDLTATIILPYISPDLGINPTVVLDSLSVLAISEHRDKFPVTSLGNKGIKGYTYGTSLVAGSFGFTVFGQNPWAAVIAKYATFAGVKLNNFNNAAYISPSSLPPMDLSLTFFNEAGQSSSIFIKSITLVDTSKTISINDIRLTDSYSFMATQCTIMIEETITNQGFSASNPSPLKPGNTYNLLPAP